MTRTRPRTAALAGALGGGMALAVLLAGSALTGQPGFLELVHNGATAYVPLPIFEAGIATFGGYAKGLLLVGIALAVPGAGALLAAIVAQVGLLARRPLWLDAAWIAVLALAIAEIVVLPLFGAGIGGSAYVGDAVALHGPLIAACAGYGAIVVGVLRGSAEPAVRPPSGGEPAPDSAIGGEPGLTRRSLLRTGAGLVAVASMGVAAVGVLARVVTAGRANETAAAPSFPPGGFGPTPAVTPVGDFYTIAKDLFPTRVDPASWRLEVGGLVATSRSFTLDELRTFPRVEGYRTLQCISNEVVIYGPLIGNQRWAGMRVADLLDAVDVQPAATHVLWRSADGFTESLPLDVARDERTWLVDEMGPTGTSLTDEHGFPLRVLIAGRYGMKQPKWLTGIELADHDEPGYWVQRGWDATAAIRTWSRIDAPTTGAHVPAGAPLEVTGVASAGDRGIDAVEVSGDDGATWVAAEIEEVQTGIGDLTWRRWRASVPLPAATRTVLVVRATDGSGTVQDGTTRPTLPSGATGWHRVIVAIDPS
jgi:DMSO/TMAO reductase YedYZ molybdopterin-dependent catalytic subunit